MPPEMDQELGQRLDHRFRTEKRLVEVGEHNINPLHLADRRTVDLVEEMEVPRLVDSRPGQLVPHRNCDHDRGCLGLSVLPEAARAFRERPPLGKAAGCWHCAVVGMGPMLGIVAGSVGGWTGLEGGD